MKSRARLLVDEQVEVALAVAGLGVDEPVVGVRERRCRSWRGARARRRRARARRASSSSPVPTTPTMSPRSRSTGPTRSAEQRSWIWPERSTRSRKTSFPCPRRAITRPGERGAVSPPSAPGSSALGLGADGGDLVPVGKALGQLRHGAASLVAEPVWPSGELSLRHGRGLTRSCPQRTWPNAQRARERAHAFRLNPPASWRTGTARAATRP